MGQIFFNTMNVPETLLYTNDHEWIKIEGDTATIGITDFAQGELGDIVYVEIETEGNTLNQGDVLGTIEAVKTVSDLFMPLSGEVLEINPDLESSPEIVNDSPYEKGWTIKISISNKSEIDQLLSKEGYLELIASN